MPHHILEFLFALFLIPFVAISDICEIGPRRILQPLTLQASQSLLLASVVGKVASDISNTSS